MIQIQPASKGMRLHIGIFGRRNVGKSSLLNALTRQEVAIVSEVAGTTTDPVEKPMEFLPLGPVLFIDTAGIDDDSALGGKRVEKTEKCFDRTDLALIVTEGGAWGVFEQKILEEFRKRTVPVIAVFNKEDLSPPAPEILAGLSAEKITSVVVSAATGKGLPELREAIIETAPADFIDAASLIGDLVGPGGMAVLVVPIDKEAPRGRLILPQVQAIRDLLDTDAFCLVVKERELKASLERLKVRPALVVTDSQAFLKVAADTPEEIPMTSFSILFSRFKGDLTTQVMGTLAIETLKPGDRILIAEACAHHPIAEDIGRVKIPLWLKQYVGGDLDIQVCQGHDFPPDLHSYRLVIHCGACMQNRREMLSRIERCRRAGVPITNYGLTIAYTLGIFARALSPFPAAPDAFRKAGHG